MKKNTLVKLLAVIVMCFMIGAVLVACGAGEPGKDGKDGKDGAPGAPGATPVVTIGEDGYWYINGEKTDYRAVGQDGKDGEDGKNATEFAQTCEVTDAGHDWSKVHVLTKHEDGHIGYKLVICAACNDADLIIDGHNFDNIVDFNEPTEEDEGSIVVDCDCGAEEEIELPVLGDEFYTFTAGNCVTDDKYAFVINTVDENGEYVINVAKEFVVEGTYANYAHVPAAEFDKDNVADCWTMSEDYVDPSQTCICEMKTHWTTPCTVDGCDYVIGADPFGESYFGYPIGHDWCDWHDSINDTDACDCEWIPIQLRECGNCSCIKCTEYRYEDGAAAKGHNFGEWQMTVLPTETTTGKAIRVCNNGCRTCDLMADPCFEEIELPALNSGKYEYTVLSEADCDTAGVAIYVYTIEEIDGTTSTIEIGAAPLAALGHTLSTEYTINANLTKVTIKCAVCGQYVQYNLPALNSGVYTITSEGKCDARVDTYTYTVKAEGNDKGEVEITFTIEVSDPHTFGGSTEKPAKADCTPVVDDETGHTYYVYKCEVCEHWIVAYFE